MSLLELCVRKAIDNLRYMESVDGVEMDLLKRILPHCTLEHLTNIEKNTEVKPIPIASASLATSPAFVLNPFLEIGLL